MKLKIELGCGDRPTPGYLHQDVTELVSLDFHCQPWQINLPEGSISEVIAIGVMEHLRFKEFYMTIDHVNKLLEKGGVFIFDVPDMKIWSKYLYAVTHGETCPFTKEHVYSTMWGWQRWTGDEHKSGWTIEDLTASLKNIGFTEINNGMCAIRERGIERNRFSRPEDAHLYIIATK